MSHTSKEKGGSGRNQVYFVQPQVRILRFQTRISLKQLPGGQDVTGLMLFREMDLQAGFIHPHSVVCRAHIQMFLLPGTTLLEQGP